MEIKTVTNLSLAVILGFFVISLIWIFIANKRGTLIKQRKVIDSFANILSTLGVLGTFLGITLGLTDFDPANIDTSIQTLLDGLKTAFYTSLAGMLCSLVVRGITDNLFDKEEKGVSSIETATQTICTQLDEIANKIVGAFNVSTLQNELSQIRSSQVTFFNSIQSQLEKMSKANIDAIQTNFETLVLLNRNQDSTLTNVASTLVDMSEQIAGVSAKIDSQVERIGEKMSDTNNLLTAKFDEFSELLQKSNTEALVEVMKKVTEEFQKQMNDLISKLVQENFEQLNRSVEKLNTWQQENKEMIQSLTSQYKEMSNNFEQTSTNLTTVAEHTQQLVGNGGKLAKLVEQLNKVMIDDTKFSEITAKLENAVSLTNTAIEEFSESNETLKEWTEDHQDMVEQVEILVAKLEELNKIRDYSDEFWKDTKQSMNEGVGIIKQGSEQLQQQLTNLDSRFYSRLNTTLSELDACIQAMAERNDL